MRRFVLWGLLAALILCVGPIMGNPKTSRPDAMGSNRIGAVVWAASGADALEGVGTGTGADALEGTDSIPDDDAEKTGASAVSCPKDGTPCIEKATGLPLLALPRPFTNIYKEMNPDPSTVTAANIPAFRPLYVFDKQGVDFTDPANPAGWMQVGTNSQKPLGWAMAKDLLEWRQALVVAYTHPGDAIEGRTPVIMFKNRSDLNELVTADDRTERLEKMLKSIEEKNPPETIISMEPKRFIDINSNFYILPILDWQTIDLWGDEVRLLQLAAAVPGQRGADTLQEQGYLDQAVTGRGADTKDQLADLEVDMVFVMDTTKSMQPYIDMTKKALTRMVDEVGREQKNRFRFGIVGYRDDPNAAPGLEYVVKNFTPELVDAEELIRIMDTSVKASKLGSKDYAEEVFAGVQAGMNSAWREGAVRFMVLAGDASAHPRNHPQSTTGKDETDLRRELDDANIHVMSLHLQDQRAAEDHELAMTQFGHLATIRGSRGQQALITIDAFKTEDYQKAVDMVVGTIAKRFNETVAGKSLPPPPPMPEFSEEPSAEQQAEIAGNQVWQAALVEYLGKGASPPKDIVAWAADRDLGNIADFAMEVRVLVTKEQLSSLVQALDRVLQAFKKAEMTQGQFFEALQSVSGQTLKRPEDLGKGPSLAESGLLPSFIQSLPYKSDILTLTDEMYASLTVDQRVQLEWGLQAKLNQYIAVNEKVDAWHRMNEADPESALVHPLHINYLP